jgi:8-oxo-dGTP pyrophosphatase MutT (NUDIX family)
LGRSEKHGNKYVTPGGKQDKADSGPIDCIVRELNEEIGVNVEPGEFKHIGTATDLTRDIRLVEKDAKLRELLDIARTTELERMSNDRSLPIICAYGVNDELYSVPVSRSSGANSEELTDVTWVDVRNLSSSDIGAGHDVVLLAYREMLEQEKTQLRVLDNFSDVSAEFAMRYS